MDGQHPTQSDVLAYAKPLIYKFIAKYAIDLPEEQKEEIEQNAYLRILKIYSKIETARGWKSYVYNHSRGAVLDYLKYGIGFYENKWSLVRQEPVGARHFNKIRHRVSNETQCEENCPLDTILSNHGIYTELVTREIEINWDLVARMSSQDNALHCFAKLLRGFEVHEISRCLLIPTIKVSKLIREFVGRFDDPYLNDNHWFLQTCFALGLCKHLGLPAQDQSHVVGFYVGWNLHPVDLDSKRPQRTKSYEQISLISEVERSKNEDILKPISIPKPRIEEALDLNEQLDLFSEYKIAR